MAKTRSLTVLVAAEIKQFQKAMRQVDKDLGGTATRSEKFGQASRRAFLSVGAAAGGAAVVGIKRSVDAFAEAQKVAAQTNAVLKSTGGIANVTAGDVDRLATAISRKSGIDDEAIASAQNLLLTFTNVRNEAGKGNDIFNQTTRIAADMATALGTDATSAAMQLGKALNDPEKGLTRLTRVGVTFTEQQKAQVAALQASGDRMGAQRVILAELNKEFGGSAEAAGNTFAGSMNKARVAVGNLGEQIGARVVPHIEKGANALVRFLEWSDRNRTAVKALAAGIGLLVTALGAAMFVTKVTAALKTLKTALVATRTAVIALNVALRANPIGLVVTALGLLAAGLVVAYKRSETFRRIVDGAFNAVKRALEAMVRAVRSLLRGDFVEVFDWVGGFLGRFASNAGRIALGIGTAIVRGIVRGIKSVASSIGDALGRSINLGGGNAGVGEGIGREIGRNIVPTGAVGSLKGAGGHLLGAARAAAGFGLQVTSGLRSGSVTSSGNQSYHSTGEAIDVAGPSTGMLAFFRTMKSRFAGALSELIYTPGGAGIKNGRPYTYGGAVAADHYDHVHVAINRPGSRPGVGDGPGRGAVLAARAARAVGFRGADLVRMVAIAGAESGYDPKINAAGPEDSRGLWQINVGSNANPDMLRLGNLYDPMVNARAMKIILGRQGLGAWTVYRTGKYKGYEAQARAAVAATRGGRAPSARRGGGRSSGPGRFGAVDRFGRGRSVGGDASEDAAGFGSIFDRSRRGDFITGTTGAAWSTTAPSGGMGGDGGPAPEVVLADAIRANTEALEGVRGEIRRQSEFAATVVATENHTLARAVSDLVSGQIAGTGVAGRALMPGAGTLARY